MSRILNKSFAYSDSVETAKPGYLKRKFDRIRAAQKAAADAAKASNVKAFGKKAAK